MKRGYKLVETFSDQWVKEFTRALACPNFKFTRHKEPLRYPYYINNGKKEIEVTLNKTKQANLDYILNLTKPRE